MEIKDQVEERNPFTDEAFRASVLGFADMAQKQAVSRLIQKLVIDWRNSSVDLETSGDVTGDTVNAAAVDCEDGVGTFEDLVVGEFAELDGGTFGATVKEVSDIWAILKEDNAISGGDFGAVQVIGISGGTFR